MKKIVLAIVAILMVFTSILLSAIRIRYGGGKEFEDRSSSPIFAGSALKIVAAPRWIPLLWIESASGCILVPWPMNLCFG